MTYVSFAEHYGGTDWQQSSGPELDRKYHLDDLWPQEDTASVAKDAIEDGLHPVMAIGAVGDRPENLTGLVKTYNADPEIAIVNVADGAVVKTYVSNIKGYSGQNEPDDWETSPIIGQPVYVDDSSDLGAGCTLSLSPLNDLGSDNPLAGWLYYCQDEYADRNVGGPNATSAWYQLTWDGDPGGEHLVCVLLTSDTGQSCCAT